MFFLLTSFMILTSCQGLHSELQEKTVRKNNLEEYYTYYWKNNEEVFHGPCIRKNMNRQFVISDDVRFYLNGKPVGGALSHYWFGWLEITLKNGERDKVVFYDFWGRKVAECILKNGLPYNGNIWVVYWGITHLKESSIVGYEEGKVVSSKDFEFERFSKLFETYLDLFPRIRPIDPLKKSE